MMLGQVVVVSIWFLSGLAASEQQDALPQGDPVDHSKNVLTNAFLSLQGSNSALVAPHGAQGDAQQQEPASFSQIDEVHSKTATVNSNTTMQEAAINPTQQGSTQKDTETTPKLQKDGPASSAMHVSAKKAKMASLMSTMNADTMLTKIGGSDKKIELAEWLAAHGAADDDDSSCLSGEEFAGYWEEDNADLELNIWKQFANNEDDSVGWLGGITLGEFAEEFAEADIVGADGAGAGLLDEGEFKQWYTCTAQNKDVKDDGKGCK